MITLDVNNGSVGFENYTVNPFDDLQNMKNRLSDKSLEEWIENDTWSVYRLDLSVEFILLFRFLDGI